MNKRLSFGRIKVKKNLVTSLLAFFCLTSLVSCGGGGKEKQIKISNAIEQESSSKKITLSLYIENSGSMDGYVGAGSSFKDDLHRYISSLSRTADSTSLNYINSSIIHINKTNSDFFQSLSAASFKAAGGNRGNSELVQMIQSILANTNKDCVSVFVSDCILDPTVGKANDYFRLRQEDLTDLLVKHIKKNPDFAIRVLELESSFDGMLYPSGQKPMQFKGQRPYYIWFMGNKTNLAKLFKEVRDDYMNGAIKNTVAYSNCPQVPFTIEYKGQKPKNGTITIPKGKKEFELSADLSNTLLSDDYLMNKDNYKKNPLLKINDIKEIKNSGSSYTHSFVIEVHANADKAQNITLTQHFLPDWANKLNDDKGDDTKKTCGIKYIITAIKEAFDNTKETTITLECK